MSEIFVDVKVKISPEDHKYCSRSCIFWDNKFPGGSGHLCILFVEFIELCLGGGPLRCEKCIAAEAKAKEIKR